MRKEFSAALRSLRVRPAFAAAVVATLAIAIGASTAVFGVVDRLLLRPLAFAEPGELVFVQKSWPLFAGSSDSVPSGAPFAQLARYEIGRVNMTGGFTPRVIRVARVTDAFFPALGIAPAAGRILPRSEASTAIVLSAALRRSLFADDSLALGQPLQLNGRQYRVGAVMPASFSFHDRGESADAWVPFIPDDELINTAQAMGSGAIARLSSALTLERAQAAMDVVFSRIAQQNPRYRLDDDDRITLVPLRDHWYGALRFPLLMLLGASACLLLIASANATGLMLARAASMQKDTAIRAALGADRDHLIRESLVESVLLGCLATVVGLLLAQWGAGALVALSPVRIPHADELGMGLRAIGFALAISLPAAGVAGLVSAWQVYRGDLTRPLAAGGRRGAFVSARMRRALVAVQVAVTVMLLLNAGLLLRSFQALRGEAIGFDPRNVLTMEIAPVDAKYPDAATRFAYYERILNEIRRRPGVAEAGIVNYLPLHSGSYIIPVAAPGRAESESFAWSYRAATPDYFRAMRIPIRAGRPFVAADRIGAPMVAVLDESAARSLVNGGPAESAVGKRITIRFGEPITFEVVGVAGDIRQQGLAIESYPGFYLSAYQRPPGVGNLVVRTTVDANAALAEVRAAVQQADAELAAGSLRALEAQVGETVSRRRFAVLVTGLLGIAALILSVLGLAALMSQLVAYRTHEIGVRVALGANSANVLGLVVRQGIGMVGIGLVAGVGGALATGELVGSLLYGVGAADPKTFVGVPVLIAGVAALACAVPARRALKADPMLAMRSE